MEMLVSMAILLVIITLLSEVMGLTQRTWSKTRANISQFRESRTGSEAMIRRLGQATLFNYWGYDNPNQPNRYQRQSSLHFVSGSAPLLLGEDRLTAGHAVFFQSMLGYSGEEAGSLGRGEAFNQLEDGLNAWGYYVEYGSDLDETHPLRPPFLRDDLARNPERLRFRLMEFRVPSERLDLFRRDFAYRQSLSDLTDREAIYQWFTEDSRRLDNSHPIAENVLAVILSPRAPGHTIRGVLQEETYIAPRYFFDSREFQWNREAVLAETTRHQLPPVVQLTLVVTDEGSWIRFADARPEGASQLASFINNRFQDTTRFEDDLGELEEELVRLKLDHRRFTVSIPLRSAKWATANQ